MSITANLIDSIRYLAYHLRFEHRRDILRQSFGIARRARDYAPEWELHHSQCRAFLRASLALSPSSQSINIIGAGRLLDLDTDLLATRMKSVRLIDIDPSAMRYWEMFAKHAAKNCCETLMETRDITGVFDTIPEYLSKALYHGRSTEDAIVALSDSLSMIKPVEVPPADIVLSLNILSQLPILLRERIMTLLCARGIIPSDDTIPESLQGALVKLFCVLQQMHIETLKKAARKLIIVLADKHFEYYQPNISERQLETAIYLDLAGAMSDYSLKLHTEWMWHIAPYGKNPEDYGSEHLVGAWAWSREQGTGSVTFEGPVG